MIISAVKKVGQLGRVDNKEMRMVVLDGVSTGGSAGQREAGPERTLEESIPSTGSSKCRAQ